MPPAGVKYLVAAAMLGSVTVGEKEDAWRLWSRYRATLFGDGPPDLLFRLLVAESAGQRSGPVLVER